MARRSPWLIIQSGPIQASGHHQGGVTYANAGHSIRKELVAVLSCRHGWRGLARHGYRRGSGRLPRCRRCFPGKRQADLWRSRIRRGASHLFLYVPMVGSYVHSRSVAPSGRSTASGLTTPKPLPTGAVAQAWRSAGAWLLIQADGVAARGLSMRLLTRLLYVAALG